jgi:hypothetical protein
MLIGFILLACGFFLALAVMDFTVMHGAQSNFPDSMYRYWMSLGLVVVIVAAFGTWMAYAAGLPEKKVPAVFATIILLLVAGLLDIFYYLLTMLKGEPYSFAIWSAQYKWFVDGLHWLPTWDWPQQIPWTIACLLLIAYIWHKVKD